MGLFGFYFPSLLQTPAQGDQLQRLVMLQGRRTASQTRQTAGLAKRVAELEKDAGFLALLLGSVLERLDRKGVVTKEDLKAEMAALDSLDGVEDGRLDIRVLRGKASEKRSENPRPARPYAVR
ncbi:MAG: hypothetical protein ACREIU_01515 [Planctomycetota bacterium]